MRALFSLCATLLVSATLSAQAPTTPELGCSTINHVTTCNWPAFRSLFDTSRVIAAESPRLEPHTGFQLEAFIKRLGKRLPSEGSPAQLTLLATSAEYGPFNVGPSDVELVELRVYRGPNSNGTLLWIETYYGQLDHPWSANVNDAIEQFRRRLTKP